MFVSSSEVLKVYDEIDGMAEKLVDAVGLHCPKGCGQCCQSPTIEALSLELLPLAQELLRRGELESTYEHLNRIGADENLCMWYRDVADPIHGGHCSVYPWRPLVCRTFGFFPVTIKGNTRQLATCQILKETATSSVACAQRWIDEHCDTFPSISELGLKLAVLDSDLGMRRLPINMALREAVSFVASQQFFSNMNQTPVLEAGG